MVDDFIGQSDTAGAPARKCFAIAPHDTNEIGQLPKAIRAPSAGVIMLRAVGSGADVAHPVLEGEIVQVRALYIRSTGTTVTGTIIGYA